MCARETFPQPSLFALPGVYVLWLPCLRTTALLLFSRSPLLRSRPETYGPLSSLLRRKYAVSYRIGERMGGGEREKEKKNFLRSSYFAVVISVDSWGLSSRGRDVCRRRREIFFSRPLCFPSSSSKGGLLDRRVFCGYRQREIFLAVVSSVAARGPTARG